MQPIILEEIRETQASNVINKPHLMLGLDEPDNAQSTTTVKSQTLTKNSVASLQKKNNVQICFKLLI